MLQRTRRKGYSKKESKSKLVLTARQKEYLLDAMKRLAEKRLADKLKREK